MVYGTYNYSYWGESKPTYNWGGHIVDVEKAMVFRLDNDPQKNAGKVDGKPSAMMVVRVISVFFRPARNSVTFGWRRHRQGIHRGPGFFAGCISGSVGKTDISVIFSVPNGIFVPYMTQTYDEVSAGASLSFCGLQEQKTAAAQETNFEIAAEIGSEKALATSWCSFTLRNMETS